MSPTSWSSGNQDLEVRSGTVRDPLKTGVTTQGPGRDPPVTSHRRDRVETHQSSRTGTTSCRPGHVSPPVRIPRRTRWGTTPTPVNTTGRGREDVRPGPASQRGARGRHRPERARRQTAQTPGDSDVARGQGAETRGDGVGTRHGEFLRSFRPGTSMQRGPDRRSQGAGETGELETCRS